MSGTCTRVYSGLQEMTGAYRGLQGHTGDVYRGAHEMTVYKGAFYSGTQGLYRECVVNVSGTSFYK